MSMQAPKYLDSPYYDERTGTLREGAPQELMDEYREYKDSGGCCMEPYQPLDRALTEDDFRDLYGDLEDEDTDDL
jgi:hypothetical protein